MDKERKYKVRGKGMTYRISANSGLSARYRAAVLYREETGSEFPAEFLKNYFGAKVVNHRAHGPPLGYKRGGNTSVN